MCLTGIESKCFPSYQTMSSTRTTSLMPYLASTVTNKVNIPFKYPFDFILTQSLMSFLLLTKSNESSAEVWKMFHSFLTGSLMLTP